MGAPRSGIRRGVFAAWAVVIVVVALLQSAVHLVVVLDAGRIGIVVDLDHSNGAPDLVSTGVVAAAAAGALSIARVGRGTRWIAAALAAALMLVAAADVVHDGPHPTSGTGWLVIALVVTTGLLLACIAATSGARPRATLALAGCLLVGSFLVNGLDQVDPWFERQRGDPIAEYQILAKEGLELIGWSLVALALWDDALALAVRGRC